MSVILLFIAFAASTAHIYVFHLARCKHIELECNKRCDALANANRKLSSENESLRAGYRSMFPHLYECGRPHSSKIEEIRKVIELASAMRSESKPE